MKEREVERTDERLFGYFCLKSFHMRVRLSFGRGVYYYYYKVIIKYLEDIII